MLSAYCEQILPFGFARQLSVKSEFNCTQRQCFIKWSPTTNQKMVSEIGHLRDVGPALKQHLINVTCLLVCCTCWKIEMWLTWIMCMWFVREEHLVMICLRSRSAALRMFFTTIVAMASDAIKTKGYILKGNIYYCKILYRYHNKFALESITSASFPQFQILIVLIPLNYIGSLISR